MINFYSVKCVYQVYNYNYLTVSKNCTLEKINCELTFKDYFQL